MSIQRIKAESKGIQLTSKFKMLPNTIITHDEQRIQQVLLNLQSNALKFTDKGKITIKAKTKL